MQSFNCSRPTTYEVLYVCSACNHTAGVQICPRLLLFSSFMECNVLSVNLQEGRGWTMSASCLICMKCVMSWTPPPSSWEECITGRSPAGPSMHLLTAILRINCGFAHNGSSEWRASIKNSTDRGCWRGVGGQVLLKNSSNQSVPHMLLFARGVRPAHVSLVGPWLALSLQVVAGSGLPYHLFGKIVTRLRLHLVYI